MIYSYKPFFFRTFFLISCWISLPVIAFSSPNDIITTAPKIQYTANYDRPMFLLEVNRFVQANGRWQLTAVAEFVNDLLQFTKGGQSFNASYEMNVAVFDEAGAVQSSKSIKSELTALTYEATNALDQITRHYFNFGLESGRYEIFVELIDLYTKRHLERRTYFTLDSLKNGIAMSNLVCVDSLAFDGLQPELHRQNIVKRYEKPGSRFFGYFEIFSQTEDSVRLDYRIYNQRGEVKISYHEVFIFTDNLVRKVLPLKEYVSLPGVYLLIVEARAGGQKRAIREQFEIKYWKPSKTLAELEFGDFGVSALGYIADPKKFKEILHADKERRELLIESFWSKRNPERDSQENALRQEFRDRVDYTIRNFSNTLYDRAGWDTERGRIFIIYGDPTEIQHRFLPDNPSRYEIWFYKNLDRQFVFLDKNGYGLYRLIHSD